MTDSEASMGLEMATSRKEREEQEKTAHEERVKDPITGAIGNLGPWQVKVCMFIFMVKFPVGWHQLSTVFLAPTPSYSCDIPSNLTDACSADCEEVIYDTSVFTNTIITEWDLICSQKYLASWVQTLFMFGILVGSILFGILSDKYGRRPPLVLAVFMQLVCGVGEAFVPWFFVFAILRFFLAVATGGSMVTSFVLIMEIVGPKNRETMSILYQIPFNIGHSTLPLFAYFLRDWRWFQFAISIVSVIYISYYWILPESPRWLLANGKIDEVEKLLVEGAERNHKSTKTIRADLDEHMKRKALLSETDLKQKARGTLLDLFKYPNLRIRTLVMGFNWLVCGLTYFGVSQYIGEISGNIFINVAISGILGIPGTLISVPATQKLGRKKALILSNCLAGISLLLIAVVGKKGSIAQVALASIGVFGMSVSFPNVYLYGGELFPTVARNAGMGFLSMAARIGAMIAPFVSGTSSIFDWLPAVLFGCPSLIASLLVLLLPETKGQALPETIEDGENFGKKKSEEK